MPPKKKTVELISCSICYDDVPLKNTIACPSCDFRACRPCQITYAKADCMNCHTGFTTKFMVENLGRKFIKEVVVPTEKAQFITEEKTQHPLYTKLIELHKKYREQKEKTRFGFRIEPDVKAAIDNIAKSNDVTKFLISKDMDVFACPDNTCRGFVREEICNVCAKKSCMNCRNLIKIDEIAHFCNPSDLATILEIKKTSKPCPNCATLIHRTEGCNHMFCTNCRTHFDWITLKILNSSTNGHYLNTANFARNIATGANITIIKNEDDTRVNGCDEWNSTTYRFPVIREHFHESLPERYLYAETILYDHLEAFIYMKGKMYDETEIIRENVIGIQKINIAFLLGEIDEETWGNKLYKLQKHRQKNILISNILHILIRGLIQLQHEIHLCWKDSKIDEDNFIKIHTLIDLTNDSLQSVNEEYGGQNIFITLNTGNLHIPPYICGSQEEIDHILAANGIFTRTPVDMSEGAAAASASTIPRK